MTYHNGALKKPRLGKAAFLGPPQTRKYRASNLAAGTWHWALQRGAFTWGDIGAMRRYHAIEIGLRTLRAPIASAKWKIEADSPEIGKWIDETYQGIWRRDLNKMLRMLEWGVMGGENVWKEDSDGLVQYDYLREIHPYDVKPLELDGKLVGLSVRTISMEQKAEVRIQERQEAPTQPTVRIPAPRSFWAINEGEFGSFYGLSRLQGAFESWMERCGKHGAIDVRRLWYIKNVFRGGLMRHPMGTIETDRGAMTCEEYAREIIEKAEAGAVMTMPDAWDSEAGHYRWEYSEPKINGNGADLLQYPKDLDLETLQGMGIMPEVIQAVGESSGGWSGRSVPMLVFLQSEDAIVFNLVDTIDQQIIKHGVNVNFGPGVKYKVCPVSLLEQPEQGQGQQPGRPPGAPSPIQDQPGARPPGGAPPGFGRGNGNNSEALPGALPRQGPVAMSQAQAAQPQAWVDLPDGF